MSRAKFEEWFGRSGTAEAAYKGLPKDQYENYYAMWRAGRESMRDEAVKNCLGKQTSNECVLSIKSIEP